MSTFKQIVANNDLKKVIKSAFDTDLALNGAWGYTKPFATILEANENHIPLPQLEHMIISMRTYLEMNMTLEKEARYGSINVNEISREQIQEKDMVYDKVTYEITAIREDIYTKFINEYKEGYGTEDFDLNKHFERRKEATLKRVVIHWFEVSKVI
jgi:predicted small secreted protein